MKLFKPGERKRSKGILALLYSEFGIGKSTSVIQTAEDPIIYVVTEPRDSERWWEAAERPDVKIQFCRYDTWQDMMKFLNEPKNLIYENGEISEKAKTIVIDSISYLMNVELHIEITDQRISEKGTKTKELVDGVKMTKEGYGGMAGQMKRLFRTLGKLSADGYTVICLAGLDERPKYDRELKAGPSLAGKDFSREIGSYCDLIGLVETRHEIDEEGYEMDKIKFPPFVLFEGDGSFMCKLTGIKLRNFGPVPLDIAKIVKLC